MYETLFTHLYTSISKRVFHVYLCNSCNVWMRHSESMHQLSHLDHETTSYDLHHQLTWSLFGNPWKARETAMLGKFGKASLITVTPSPNASNICTIYHHIIIYDPFWSYVIPCSKMHMIFNDQDESTVCLDGSNCFHHISSSLVEAWPPANQALGSHKERRFDWASGVAPNQDLDPWTRFTTHHLVFLQIFGKSFSTPQKF